MEELNQMLKEMDFNFFGSGQHSMGVDGLRNNLGNNDYLFLDIRTPEEQNYISLPFMIHIPLNELPDRIKDLPTDKCIVTFCSSIFRAAVAYTYLKVNGFNKVKGFTASIEDLTMILKPGPLAKR